MSINKSSTLSLEEINNLGLVFFNLKTTAEKTKQASDILILEKFKNNLAIKLQYILDQKLAPYRKYPNYQDLKQDAGVSLSLALRSFSPEHGNFAYWLHQYAKVKIPRCASKHKVVKVPLKKAKDANIQILNLNSIFKELKRKNFSIEDDILNKNYVNYLLKFLDKTEKSLIEKRFGLNNQEKLSIIELEKFYNINNYELNKKIKIIFEKLTKAIKKVEGL